MKKLILLGTLSSLALIGLLVKTSKDKDIPTTGAIYMPEYKNEIKGIIARFENDDVMLLSEKGEAIILAGTMNFSGLENGDELTIFYDDLEDPFPSKTIVKEMILNSKGDVSRINQEILNKIEGLGWILKK